ncbi:MAG: Peptidase [Chthoniobacter sp.]|nr:Peptidase [Chthoniobacter sp.]
MASRFFRICACYVPRAVLFAALALAACDRKSPPEPAPADPSSSNEAAASPAPGGAPQSTASTVKRAPLPAGPHEIWKEFSGEKAFEHVRQQVEIGPRPSGSPGAEKARVLIESGLRAFGWQTERQTFTDTTPRGPVQFANVIGRFIPPGAKAARNDTQRAIVCSHYDTKRFSTISFVGASDGASSTGALLEMARTLALDPALAAQVELVFFDGEEAVVQFTETDGLYGSRHYAQQLRGSGRAAQFQFGILWDMIGDRDFNITLSSDSPPELTRAILAAADALQLRHHFRMFDRAIYDDHVPLNTIARIPAIDLIDFDYLYWHTADDTLERVGPEGLQKTAAVTLYHLRKTLK